MFIETIEKTERKKVIKINNKYSYGSINLFKNYYRIWSIYFLLFTQIKKLNFNQLDLNKISIEYDGKSIKPKTILFWNRFELYYNWFMSLPYSLLIKPLLTSVFKTKYTYKGVITHTNGEVSYDVKKTFVLKILFFPIWFFISNNLNKSDLDRIND